MNSKKVGQLGERIAKEYLQRKGYKILAKNFKRKWGEMDIIAKKKSSFALRGATEDKDKIIFFEVKTIQKKEGFLPEDEIGTKKKRQLLKMALIYFCEQKIPLDTSYQIDILAIELFEGKAKIRHLENAIEDRY